MINLQKIQKEKPIKQLLEFCIINADKPSGYTSFEVAEKIRKIFSARKTGHFGEEEGEPFFIEYMNQ